MFDAVELSRPLSIHVVGVGGAGMSAIAEVLVAMGHRVSGSDQRPSGVLDRVERAGVAVSVGHHPENLGRPDLVAVSTAVSPENPEVVAARSAGIPVLSRARLLAAITGLRPTVSVAGTHGKTTTSALLAHALLVAEADPSYVVGGSIGGDGGARWSDGGWLVVEADESDGTFVELSTQVAVVTSVEPDHLEHYGGMAGLTAAFARFAAAAPGGVVACADDPGAAALAPVGAHTYGFADAAEFRIVDYRGGRDGSSLAVRHGGRIAGEISVPVPGRHNALNATAAVVAATLTGVPLEAAASGVASFPGVRRRFQRRGEHGGATLVDDYAHLPAEVSAALAAAAEGGWGRVVCVFQPHRYSRTEALWRDFAHAFTGADVVVVTELYSAGEAPRPGVSGRLVADAVRTAHPAARVEWVPERAALVDFLAGELGPGDLCLTLGAGDLTTLADELRAR